MPRRRLRPYSATQPTWPGTTIPQPPNIGFVVERVNARRPELLRTNTPAADVEFLTLVCAEPEAKQYAYGLLSKPNPGSPDPRGYTFPPEYRADTKCAMDVLALPDGNRVDVINGSDNAPTPGTWCWNPVAPFDAHGNSQWRDSDVYLDITDWPPFDSGTSEADELPAARLGWGWFCAIRAVKDWHQRALDNRTYIERELNPDYYRVIGDLNGTPHLQPGEVDFWSMAGCDITAPDWLDDARRALDFLRRKVWFTASGSVTHWQTADQRRRNNDRIVQLFDGRWDQVEILEGANEYRVNGWTDAMLQDWGRDMRSKVPAGVLITLSSPDLAHGVGIENATNEDMADAIEALYGTGGSDHYGANEITVHLVRDFSIKWSVPGAYNGIKATSGWRVDLPYNNGEPLGPGASTGGDISDPAVVIGTYIDTSEAAWRRYTGHSAWCVFNGTLPDEWKGPEDVPNVWEQPNMQAIMNGMRDERGAAAGGGEDALVPYRLEGTMERGAFLGPAGMYLRIDPAEAGQGMWEGYPVHFDREVVGAHEVFVIEALDDDTFKLTHEATGQILGVDATQHTEDLTKQYYTMPPDHVGPYESFQLLTMPSGVVIAIIEYERDGRRYTSAPIAWVKEGAVNT